MIKVKLQIITISDKNKGLCVAGFMFHNGETKLIRLISDDRTSHNAIHKDLFSSINLGDIIEISVIEQANLFNIQKENYLWLDKEVPHCTKLSNQQRLYSTLEENLSNLDHVIFL